MSTLTQKTLVPISVLVSVTGAVLWLNNTLQDIRYDVASIKRSLRQQWTVEDMSYWVEQVRINNPGVKLPDVMGITRNRLLSQ